MSDLNKEIKYVKGIGPKRANKLNKLGIFTVSDLAYYFPRQYEDRNNLKKIFELEDEEKVTIRVIVNSIETSNIRKGLVITKIGVRDETGFARLVFFNQEYISSTLKKGDTILVFGKVKKNSHGVELSSCEIEQMTNNPKNTCGIMPIYSLTYGLTNKELTNIIKTVFNNEQIKIKEYLPKRIIEKYKLCSIDYAVKNLHAPSSKDSLKIALYRLVFEEFLMLQLGLFLFKNGVTEKSGIFFEKNQNLKQVLNSLPFNLTNAQNRALNEILNDMNSNKVMNRLVQGDVGSGKTVVALLSLANCVLNGYQGALMAPTEILANQHYLSLIETFEKLGIKVALLTGSLKGKKREELLKEIEKGNIKLIIGTHAIIQENVKFKRLGLIVIDEQHRFGVAQRKALRDKGILSNLIVMSATPIPRSLALSIYGDLDVGIIDELPPGRKPIKTKWINNEIDKEKMYNFIGKKLLEGRQAYFVAPLIEESEKLSAKSTMELFEEVSTYLKGFRVGLLHGKMGNKEKDEIMNGFKKGDINILISTLVIEVGVNVPNASIMVISDSERFGLSTLHQLRGRVGRGEHQSYCFLISKTENMTSEARLKILEETQDGFKIAEEDLKLRKAGEIFGTRQSGISDLKFVDIVHDIKTIKLVKDIVTEYLKENRGEIKNKILEIDIEEKFKDSLTS